MKYKIIRRNPDGSSWTYRGIFTLEKANSKMNSLRAYYQKEYPNIPYTFSAKEMVNKPKYAVYSELGEVISIVESLEDAQQAVEGNEFTYHLAA